MSMLSKEMTNRLTISRTVQSSFKVHGPTVVAALEPALVRAGLLKKVDMTALLAFLDDYMERDAAEERPLPNCLVGIAALHLFDPGFRAPNCPRHRQLYRPAVVSATVRRHVCALERERRRALAAIAGSTTNEEWV